MFLFTLAPQDITNLAQDDATFDDVVHHWHRDLLAFVHGDLPRMLLILAVAFVLARVATLTLAVDASADPDRVLSILRATALAVRNDPAFQQIALADPVIPSIDAINDHVVTYPISIRVAINQKDAILRELRRRILLAFEQNAIPLGSDPNNLLLMPHPESKLSS